jgi:hypothetical protein
MIRKGRHEAPKKKKNNLEIQMLPENLSNVRIVFFFNPATREEDMEYMKMVEVYRMLLELRGAKVTVQRIIAMQCDYMIIC